MLARISGGNSGIREYLEYGMKQGCEFSRDEFDERVILDGDLFITDAMINQAEDKSQERYLHITLSFRERDIDVATLSAVTEEYKTLLMAAYGKDEYNFYAEAHLPKIQTVTDKKTGEKIERKPHVHIVIPKINALTKKSMNPTGMINKHTEYLDALQEYINKKYHLESPKDFVRDGDNHYADIISRIKGDVYGGNKNDIQKKLISLTECNNIRDFSVFKKTVSLMGEVKVRNAGKTNEYLAVKIAGDARFTNLKSPVFSRSYINERKISTNKLTDKQIAVRVEKWVSTVSKEIKFVHSATPSFREKYYGAGKDEQRNLLTDREINYERKHRGSNYQGTTGRQNDNQSRINDSGRRNTSRYTYCLSGLPQCGLVYGISGKELHSEQTERVLPHNAQRVMANEWREKPEYSGLRRSGYHERTGRERLTVSGVPEQALKTVQSSGIQVAEKAQFAEIRRHLKADRLLAVLKNQYGLVPDRHPVTFAKDGSARINAGKVNLNVSDFLTKHMNLPWSEAKTLLASCYAEQKQDADLALSSRVLRAEAQALKSASWTQYKEDKTAVWQQRLSPPERQASLTVAIFERLQREELIREQIQAKIIVADIHGRTQQDSPTHSYPSEKENLMGLADAFKGTVPEKTDAFVSTDLAFGVRDNMVRLRKEQDMLIKLDERLRLNDLMAKKVQNGTVEYQSRQDGNAVFKDTGARIVFTKNQQKENNIALGLEVAIAKYGHSLKLTGSEAFKEKAVRVAAERGISVVFKPEQYQKALEQEKARLAHEKLASSRGELATGLIDQAGKSRVKDDILNVNGNSIKVETEAKTRRSEEETDAIHKKGMSM